MSKHTKEELIQWQALPLGVKVKMSCVRIRDWVNYYGESGVYISFSGGKDSTVLLHLVREVCGYKNVPAVFCDTGLEYPEIREHVKTFDNVVWLKPKMNFRQIIEKYGYPFISKDVSQAVYDVRIQSERNGIPKRETNLWRRNFQEDSEHNQRYQAFSRARYDFLNDAPFKLSHKCCDVTKKNPSKEYEKKTGRVPILGTMAYESRLRSEQWYKNGCNAYDIKRPVSKPLSFWTEQDVLEYIKENNIKICSVYGDIVEDVDKVGVMDGQMSFADLFGDEYESQKPPLKTTGLERTGCMFCGFGCHVKKDVDKFVEMKETHPQTYEWIMKPWDEGGLDYKNVIDWINANSGGQMHINY